MCECEIVQLLGRAQLLVTPWTAAHQAFLSFTISWSLLKLMSIESVVPSDCLVPVVPFSSHLQSFLASGSFPVRQLFASDGQSFGVSASTSVLPKKTQDSSPLRWTGWISLQSRGSQESSRTPQFKSISSLVLSFLYSPTLTRTHNCLKNHSLD